MPAMPAMPAKPNRMKRLLVGFFSGLSQNRLRGMDIEAGGEVHWKMIDLWALAVSLLQATEEGLHVFLLIPWSGARDEQRSMIGALGLSKVKQVETLETSRSKVCRFCRPK
jgi:hypothetical protein